MSKIVRITHKRNEKKASTGYIGQLDVPRFRKGKQLSDTLFQIEFDIFTV